jgi:Sec7-like guanine-nucleotide exchange factor
MAKNYVTKEVFDMMMTEKDEKIKTFGETIKKLESNQNKIAWLIITAVVVAVLALVI